MVLAESSTIAYVGTYTGGKSRGIYAYRVATPSDGDPQFQPLGLVAATDSPTFLTIDAARRLVFAVNETRNYQGETTGSVSAYSADPVTGQLTLINRQPSHGTHPCHLVLDASGRFLLVANYSSGSVAVFPVAADGRLGEASDVVQHHGHSIDPKRQEGPHAHCVTFDPARKFVFICDLGLDRIVAYQLDATTGKLVAVPSAGASITPGAGPRHLVFGNDGRIAYALNELNSTVTVLAYDAASGRMTELQTLSSVPADYAGRKWSAEISVHPSGKWLYVSNRAHDSIALFAIDPAKGTLTLVASQPSDGQTPRHFALLPGARHLVVANQDSDSMRLCRVDPASGRLEPIGELIEVPKPVCVDFFVTNP
jgi:6-phosphogluconolactonase